MRQETQWTTIFWEGWTALALCAAAVFWPGSAALGYPAVLWPGLALAAAHPPAGLRPSKVFVHLFQKVADSKGSAFGRHPQMAERFILQAYLGVWGPLQEKGPQGPSFLRPARRETASPMGRWPRRGQRGP